MGKDYDFAPTWALIIATSIPTIAFLGWVVRIVW